MTVHGAKGLRVPDRDRVRDDDACGAAAWRGAGAVPVDRWLRDQARRRASRPTSSSCTSRSTSRWASTRSCGSSTSRAPRARDHLVVSVPPQGHATLGDESVAHGRTPSCCGTPRQGATFAGLGAHRRRRPPRRAELDRRAAAGPRDMWQGERDAARSHAARAGGSSPRPRSARRADAVATVADPGLAKDGRDLELPPWNKGRYGTAIGRAVHAVLQTIDLTTGSGLDDSAAAQAAAEGVLGQEATIAALVRAALGERDGPYRRGPTALAGDLRRRAGRGHDARGLHRSRLPRRRAVSSSSTTRPTRSATRPTSPGAWVTTGSRARRTPSPPATPSANPSSRACSCSSIRRGAREIRIDGTDLAAAIAEVREFVAEERRSPSALAPAEFGEP